LGVPVQKSFSWEENLGKEIESPGRGDLLIIKFLQIGRYISKEILTLIMETKIVKVTDKGQISIPISIRESADIKKGDELLMIESGRTILIEKVRKSDFRDLLKHSEKVAFL